MFKKDEMVVHVLPKDVKDSRVALYPPLSELEEMGFIADSLLAIPIKYKNRFILLVNLMKEIISQGDGGKRLDIHEDLWGELKRLTQCLVYLTNSASFRDDKCKYFDFDKEEINKKLGRCVAE